MPLLPAPSQPLQIFCLTYFCLVGVINTGPRGHPIFWLSVFSALAKYMVVKITHSSSEVIL
jgi:hypothetical protein